MSAAPKINEKPHGDDSSSVHRIRITLTSRNARSLENVCCHLNSGVKNQKLHAKGSLRMPTNNLRITIRKTPRGEDSKTWNHFQMKVHKRIIDLHSPSEIDKKISGDFNDFC